MQSEERTKKIITLIGKQIRGELNANDERDLKIWISESESNKILFDQLTDPLYRQGELMEIRSFTKASSAFANFMEKYGDRARAEDDIYIPTKPQAEEKHPYESLKYAIIIIVLLTLSIGFFLYLKNRNELKNDIKLSQQSIINSKANHIFEQVPEEDILWKQGVFVFDGETLESLMRKIARWYHVDVVYADSNIGKKLCSGSVSGFGNIASLLNKLERTGLAKFKINGRRILVQSRHQ